MSATCTVLRFSANSRSIVGASASHTVDGSSCATRAAPVTWQAEKVPEWMPSASAGISGSMLSPVRLVREPTASDSRSRLCASPPEMRSFSRSSERVLRAP